MKKKIVALCLCIALAVVAIGGATLAYFTDTKDVTNTFTVGNVKIKLDEKDITATDGSRTENGNAYTIYPGASVEKDPTVTNIGENAAYVRVKVVANNVKTMANQLGQGVDLATIFTGFNSTKWTRAGTPTVTNNGETYTYVYNYYTTLAKGENTGALFTKVEIPTTITDMGSKQITITITAEAIQADGMTNAADAFAKLDKQLNG